MITPTFGGIDSRFQIRCDGFLFMYIQSNVFLNQVLFGLVSNFDPNPNADTTAQPKGFQRFSTCFLG